MFLGGVERVWGGDRVPGGGKTVNVAGCWAKLVIKTHPVPGVRELEVL